MNDQTLTPAFIYTLDVRIPDQLPRKLEVVDEVLAGLDPRNDLIIVDEFVSAKHFLFRKKQNVLTVHYLGDNGKTHLNNSLLTEGQLYILDKGDILRVGKIQIRILKESGFVRTPEADHRPLIYQGKVEEHLPTKPKIVSVKKIEKEEVKVEELLKNVKPAPVLRPKKVKPKTKQKFFDFSTVKFIPYKIYGFLFDVCFTYFLLSFVLPKLHVVAIAISLLSPVSSFFLTKILPFTIGTQFISLIEFTVLFHLTMITSALLLGTTPGAFFIGLHLNEESLLLKRFKAYLLALLNIFTLPFLVFDIPLIRGKNVKELLTSSSHVMHQEFRYKLIRKTVVPLFCLFSLASPLFLQGHYTAPLTIENVINPKYVDVHTTMINTNSRAMGIELRSEVGSDYVYLPLLEKGKIGLQVYDRRTNKFLTMKEHSRASNEELLYQLRYANPFSSFSISSSQIESESLKNLSVQSLQTSLNHLIPDIKTFGLFFSNGFLFKDHFLNEFQFSDQFFMMPFDLKNPAIRISALDQGKRREKLFLFTRKEVIEFEITYTGSPKIVDDFFKQFIAPMRFFQGDMDSVKTPQILEALDSGLRQNYLVLLTYYINEVKKSQGNISLEYNAFLKKNVEETKLTLPAGTRQNILKSFDDLINSL